MNFRDQEINIIWQEVYAAMTLTLWCLWVSTKCILLHSDYLLTLHIMAHCSSCSKPMMMLVHSFTMLAMQHSIKVLVQHMPGANNEIADALSHFQDAHLRNFAPDANGFLLCQLCSLSNGSSCLAYWTGYCTVSSGSHSCHLMLGTCHNFYGLSGSCH